MTTEVATCSGRIAATGRVCFRPAVDLGLCSRHLAARRRSAEGRGGLVSPAFGKILRDGYRTATLSEVLRRVVELDANPIRNEGRVEWNAFHNWTELRRWLEDQVIERPSGT